MKYLSKIVLLITTVSLLMMACTKEGALPLYTTGNAPVLSSSKATIAATPADSSSNIVTISWSDPAYANNSATTKYVLEIDSVGRNFAKAATVTVIGKLSKTFTGKEFNDILLGLGFNFNVAYGIDVRVTSSYANNNDMKVSGILKLSATAYKVPPKINPPTSGTLFIVGDATDGDWTNPVPLPTQEFARIDETTFVGVFFLKDNKEFLVLPVNGDWNQKYAIQNNSAPGIQAGGDFQFYISGGNNFKSPADSGFYVVTMDFQRGKFTIAPSLFFTRPQMPTDLYMVGDATPGKWDNPAVGSLGVNTNLPPQPLTRLNSCVWEMPTINITGGKEYLVLPVAGSWSNKYAVNDNTLPGLSAGGDFGYNLNKNFPGPAVSGNYKFEFNFATAKFKTTKL